MKKSIILLYLQYLRYLADDLCIPRVIENICLDYLDQAIQKQNRKNLKKLIREYETYAIIYNYNPIRYDKSEYILKGIVAPDIKCCVQLIKRTKVWNLIRDEINRFTTRYMNIYKDDQSTLYDLGFIVIDDVQITMMFVGKRWYSHVMLAQVKDIPKYKRCIQFSHYLNHYLN